MHSEPLFTLDDVRKEYRRLDELCGVDTSDIQLSISKRGVRRLGFCRSRKENGKIVPKEISLSDMIFYDENLMMAVIRHEYCHALVELRDNQANRFNRKKGHGHDYVWKRACGEVGCDPSRLLDTSESEVYQQRQEEKVKYVVRCKNCGHAYKYFRRSRVVDELSKQHSAGRETTSRFWCSHCKVRETLFLEKGGVALPLVAHEG